MGVKRCAWPWRASRSLVASALASRSGAGRRRGCASARIAGVAALLLASPVAAQTLPARPTPVASSEADGRSHAATSELDVIVQRLIAGVHPDAADARSQSHDRAAQGSDAVALSEPDLIDAVELSSLTAKQATVLWEYFADADNAARLTLPIVEALIVASDTPQAREAMWSELAALARSPAKGEVARRERTLLGLFEAHREELLALLGQVRESEGASDEMIALMLSSKVFGADIEESVARVTERIPAAIARYIERKRSIGHTVRWEYTAFESMVRWKDAQLASTGARRARTLDRLDAVGEDFIAVFNFLHTLDEGYREVILKGLGAAEIFNAVVAGEKELYRLGTSGYRKYLHPAVMRGIAESGSFEAFLDRVLPGRLGADATAEKGRRGIVFLRVAASFGLIESVLETVRDRDQFVDDTIAAVGDPGSFEANSAVLLDVLTGTARSAVAVGFREALLGKLYERYRREGSGRLRSVYGSMLSVYQSLSNDHRQPDIDSSFPIDEYANRIAFDRLFTVEAGGIAVHRMFMRMDETEDDVETFAAFKRSMQSLGATSRVAEHFEVFTITGNARRIEIYANKPSARGLRLGIEEIADALAGARVETMIGRGHTSIVAPLQKDARRLLGKRVGDVSAVIVGACGGDASVRELIRTFGYIALLTTRSTGRQVINDSIIKAYIAELLAMPTGARLAMDDVLRRATHRFLDMDEELRSDASLYHVNEAAVAIALLFDSHVRRHADSARHLASE